MNAIFVVGAFIAIVLAIQLGRIQTQLYYIEKHLSDIAKHTSKEYRC